MHDNADLHVTRHFSFLGISREERGTSSVYCSGSVAFVAKVKSADLGNR